MMLEFGSDIFARLRKNWQRSIPGITKKYSALRFWYESCLTQYTSESDEEYRGKSWRPKILHQKVTFAPYQSSKC